MATFTIGGGQSGNISPFLTGKATPMSLPPGYLAESGRQAAALQKGIAGVGADIGKVLVARAKEEERSEGYDVLIEALEKRAQQSGEFPGTEDSGKFTLPVIPPPGELATEHETYEVAPDSLHRADRVTKGKPGDALAGILGGDVAEKYRSGKMRSSQKEAIVKAMMGWEANMFGKTRRQLDDLLLDKALREEADRKAFSKTSQAVLQDRMIPEQTVTEITEKTISPQAINAMQVKLANQEPLSPDEFDAIEALGRQEDFETRVPEGIKARTLEEQGARREDINLIWEWLGQPPLENYSPSVQAGVAKVYDELPEGMMAKAKSLGQARGAGYKEAVKKRLADHVRESGENSPAPYTRTKEEIEKWNLMRGRKPVPKSERETAVEMELRKNEAEYIALTSTPYSTATGKRYEERIRKLKRELGGLRNKREAGRVIRDRDGNPIVPQFRPPAGGLGTAFENILSEAVTPESISRMEPEDQALFTDMVEPLYTGGERVIGTEEVERVIPGREKSPTELRGEIRDALMAGDNWTPDTKKKLDELMPEYAPGELRQATVNIKGQSVPLGGFLFDPINKKYIETGTNEPLEWNEVQSKIGVYRNQMIEAESQINKIMKRAEDLPGMEGERWDPTSPYVYWNKLGSLGTNWLKSDLYLQYDAAMMAWALAKARFDSGAAVPETEQRRYVETFFPRVGENEATVKAKRRTRSNSLNTLNTILGTQRINELDKALGGATATGGAAGGTSGKFSFQGGELKLNK